MRDDEVMDGRTPPSGVTRVGFVAYELGSWKKVSESPSRASTMTPSSFSRAMSDSIMAKSGKDGTKGGMCGRREALQYPAAR